MVILKIRKALAIYKHGTGLLVLIASVAVAIALGSFLYSSYSANLLTQNAIKDIDRTARIQANDISKILESKIADVRNNLLLISKSNRVQFQDVGGAAAVFSNGQESTKDFTDSYFWIDKDGKVLWANSFSDKEIYQKYAGADRSDRPYYSIPKSSHSFHVSNVIESADGVPRIFFSYPILSEDGTDTFKGVVVASANPTTLGQYLKAQLSSETPNTIGFMSKDATILYSQDDKLIGLNYYGKEFQSQLPEGLKKYFNAVITKSLHSLTLGQGTLSYQGNSGSITYIPVTVDGADVGVLYIVAPYTLAIESQEILNSQRNFTILSIAALAGVAIAAAIAVMKWNKGLRAAIASRTAELEDSNLNLKNALEELKVHDRMQKEFINIAAHELRTPVQPILTMAELAQIDNNNNDNNANSELGGGTPNKEVIMRREDLEMILRNARRLERLSSDILEVARIESQSIKLHKETFDINEKIRSVIADVHSRGPDGKREIDIVFESADHPILVEADKTKIFEVISNLLGNAIKFTPSGGKITIAAEERKEEGEVIVSIKDKGSGIDPDIMPKLFTKFATKSFTGTGLGLYISKAIIGAHESGRIWAENNPDGKGATFSFSLKLQHDRDKLEKIQQPSHDAKII